MAKSFADLENVAKEHGVGTGGGQNGFLTLQEGNNRIRLVSGFEAMGKHWGNRKMLGVCVGKEKGCEWCNAPEEIDPTTNKPKDRRPSVRFLMWVIDREEQIRLRADAEVRGENPNGVVPPIKIAEFGYSVVEAMRDLSQEEEYAFEGIPPYDMNIKKTVENGGKTPSDTSYSVIAARQNSELTQAEKDAVAQLTDISLVVERMKNKALGIKDEDAAPAAPAQDDTVEEIDPEDLP